MRKKKKRKKERKKNDIGEGLQMRSQQGLLDGVVRTSPKVALFVDLSFS